ncbi:MAG: 30S ribosomal protein S9 [Patescibacteria group bacterium]|nr:30S ribosomal protein S9 [Patescibacteria group bacterium]
MAKVLKTEEEIKIEKKTPKGEYLSAVGKRKESVARVRLYKTVKDNLMVAGEKAKKGEIFVNDKKIEKYFSSEIAKAHYLEPLKITNNLDKYVLTFKVAGGGRSGQLDAVIHAISRVLSLVDPKNRQILKKRGLLTRDSRIRERRKVGMGGKARRKRQSPKR